MTAYRRYVHSQYFPDRVERTTLYRFIVLSLLLHALLVALVGTRTGSAPERGDGLLGTVGSSRVDLQACKLEYSIVSPK